MESGYEACQIPFDMFLWTRLLIYLTNKDVALIDQ